MRMMRLVCVALIAWAIVGQAEAEEFYFRGDSIVTLTPSDMTLLVQHDSGTGYLT